MEIISSTHAKTHFNEILQQIQGDKKKLAITSHGKIVAYLTPVESTRQFELAKGKVKLNPGWEDPLTDENLWYDSCIFPVNHE